MPPLFWLSLLLGYLAGIAAALVLLPGAMVQPLYGKLAVASAVVVGGVGLLMVLSRRHAVTRVGAAGQVPEGRAEPAPAARADAAAGSGAQPAAALEPRPGTGGRLRVVPAPEEGISARELRQALCAGRVDAFVQPIVSLPERGLAFYHAVPRLRAADGRHLRPSEYLGTAARCGLLGLIDQVLVVRCAQMVRRARVSGRAMSIFVAVGPGSLHDAGFVAAVGSFLADHPDAAPHLVLELDRVRLDRPAEQALARLRQAGLRLCLRRLSLEGLDPAELVARGFEFVKLEATPGGGGPDGQTVAPELLRQQERLERAGVSLFVAPAAGERVLVEAVAPAIELSEGARRPRSGAAA